MSTDFHLELVDNLPLEKVASILIEKINIKLVETTDRMIEGLFNGGVIWISYPTDRSKKLCHELYGVAPQTHINFGVDKFSSAAVYYESILNGIIALVKATNGDAIACEEDRVLLRRLDGKITLYNDSGLFDPDMKIKWRPKFDFEHAFKEKFER